MSPAWLGGFPGFQAVPGFDLELQSPAGAKPVVVGYADLLETSFKPPWEVNLPSGALDEIPGALSRTSVRPRLWERDLTHGRLA